MRLDKYLKVSRLIKRRTVAKEAALNERIFINDKLSKPSSIIKVDDLLTLNLGFRVVKVKITSLMPSKDELMYDLISDVKKDKNIGDVQK